MLDFRRRLLLCAREALKPIRVKGEGRVQWQSTFSCPLPSAVVHGTGYQKRLSGANLLDLHGKTQSCHGITVTENPDGSFTLNGTTEKAYPQLLKKSYVLDLIPGRTYTLDTCGVYSPDAYIQVQIQNQDGLDWYMTQRGPITFTALEKTTYTFSFILNKANYSVEHLTFYPILTEGRAGSGFEPYCGGVPAPNPEYPVQPVFLEKAQVGARGKNLLDLRGKLKSGYGVTVTENPDGSVSFQGMTEKNYPGFLSERVVLQPVPGRVYRLDSAGYHSDQIYCQILEELNGKQRWYLTSAGPVMMKAREGAVYQFGITVPKAGTVLRDVTIYPVFSAEETENGYEPYYDGGTATLPMLRALPGGVGDEVDVVSGRITKRVKETTLGEPQGVIRNWCNGRNAICWSQLNARALTETTAVCSGDYISDALLADVWKFPDRSVDNPFLVVGQRCLYGLPVRLTGVQPEDSDAVILEKTKKYMQSHPIRIWYAMKEPVIEYGNPAILRQRTGDTQLIQEGGAQPALVEADVFPTEE